MNDLAIIENDLVPVYVTDTGEKVVYGTELHEVLKVKSKFADWIKNRLQDCDAIECEDFETFSKILEKGRPSTEYLIRLDTAKEMAMLERNDIGKQVRKYFIEVEKRHKQAAIDRSQLSPQLQQFYALADGQAKMEIEQKRQAEHLSRIEQTVTNMKEIFGQPIGDWKAEINSRVREISQRSGIDYQALYNQLYGELETTAHCSLKRLQDNKVARMEKAGNTKTAIKDGTTKIAIIYEKPQLKAIFESIVKRYAMKYCA
jgi:phage anti-repressor protein